MNENTQEPTPQEPMAEAAQYQPRKGGMVEQARNKQQAEEAQLAEHNASQAAASVRKPKPVTTRSKEPNAFTAKTPIVATGGASAVIQLLGYDVNRQYAIIIALDEPIVLANSLAMANDSRNATNAAGLPTSGFVLPTGTRHEVRGAAAVYAAATSATPTRISVWAEIFTDGEGQ